MGEYQLDKLVSDMKARKKIMRWKEDDLKRNQKAIDQFQFALLFSVFVFVFVCEFLIVNMYQENVSIINFSQ